MRQRVTLLALLAIACALLLGSAGADPLCLSAAGQTPGFFARVAAPTAADAAYAAGTAVQLLGPNGFALNLSSVYVNVRANVTSVQWYWASNASAVIAQTNFRPVMGEFYSVAAVFGSISCAAAATATTTGHQSSSSSFIASGSNGVASSSSFGASSLSSFSGSFSSASYSGLVPSSSSPGSSSASSAALGSSGSAAAATSGGSNAAATSGGSAATAATSTTAAATAGGPLKVTSSSSGYYSSSAGGASSASGGYYSSSGAAVYSSSSSGGKGVSSGGWPDFFGSSSSTGVASTPSASAGPAPATGAATPQQLDVAATLRRRMGMTSAGYSAGWFSSSGGIIRTGATTGYGSTGFPLDGLDLSTGSGSSSARKPQPGLSIWNRRARGGGGGGAAASCTVSSTGSVTVLRDLPVAFSASPFAVWACTQPNGSSVAQVLVRVVNGADQSLSLGLQASAFTVPVSVVPSLAALSGNYLMAPAGPLLVEAVYSSNVRTSLPVTVPPNVAAITVYVTAVYGDANSITDFNFQLVADGSGALAPSPVPSPSVVPSASPSPMPTSTAASSSGGPTGYPSPTTAPVAASPSSAPHCGHSKGHMTGLEIGAIVGTGGVCFVLGVLVTLAALLLIGHVRRKRHDSYSFINEDPFAD